MIFLQPQQFNQERTQNSVWSSARERACSFFGFQSILSDGKSWISTVSSKISNYSTQLCISPTQLCNIHKSGKYTFHPFPKRMMKSFNKISKRHGPSADQGQTASELGIYLIIRFILPIFHTRFLGLQNFIYLHFSKVLNRLHHPMVY